MAPAARPGCGLLEGPCCTGPCHARHLPGGGWRLPVHRLSGGLDRGESCHRAVGAAAVSLLMAKLIVRPQHVLLAVLVASRPCTASRDYSIGMHDCYDMVEPEPGKPLEKLQVNCEGAKAGSRGVDTCFLLCGFCATPSLRFGLSKTDRALFCAPPDPSIPAPNITEVGALVSSALMNVSTAHGYQFRAPNATADMAHLLSYMNRADLQALFAQPILMIDFLNEHLNYALKVQGAGTARNVTYEMWQEYVLPFGFLDEKRDVYWRWRPIFHKTFSSAPTIIAAKTITEAVHAMASLIPKAQMLGVVAIAGVSTQPSQPAGGGSQAVPAGNVRPYILMTLLDVPGKRRRSRVHFRRFRALAQRLQPDGYVEPADRPERRLLHGHSYPAGCRSAIGGHPCAGGWLQQREPRRDLRQRPSLYAMLRCCNASTRQSYTVAVSRARFHWMPLCLCVSVSLSVCSHSPLGVGVEFWDGADPGPFGDFWCV